MFKKKPLIVFEGIEGSGKTTHIKNIESHLKKKKIKFISLREPGGSVNSEKIRKLILKDKSNFHSFSDLLLYLASRNENINKIIKRNYGKKVILIDRFIDSTIAYQHFGMKVNKRIIDILNKHILGRIKISFTFLNIVSVKNMSKRLSKRNILNRYDKFNLKFYKNVQNGFLKIAANNKKYKIINSDYNLSKNKNIIINKVNKLIK